MTSNSDFVQSVDELFTLIKKKFDLKGGQIDKIVQEEPMLHGIITICWKKNVKLVLTICRGKSEFCVEKNGERVSVLYNEGTKFEDGFWRRFQTLLVEVKNGDFDNKKTLSEKIAEVVNKRQLTSYMNDTKWKEFLDVMTKKMPLEVPYTYKTLFEEEPEKLSLGTAYDAESFNWYIFKSLEWVKVKPRFCQYIYQGLLVENKEVVHDLENEFVEWMDKLSIHYEYDSVDEMYVIYGYK